MKKKDKKSKIQKVRPKLEDLLFAQSSIWENVPTLKHPFNEEIVSYSSQKAEKNPFSRM